MLQYDTIIELYEDGIEVVTPGVPASEPVPQTITHSVAGAVTLNCATAKTFVINASASITSFNFTNVNGLRALLDVIHVIVNNTAGGGASVNVTATGCTAIPGDSLGPHTVLTGDRLHLLIGSHQWDIARYLLTHFFKTYKPTETAPTDPTDPLPTSTAIDKAIAAFQSATTSTVRVGFAGGSPTYGTGASSAANRYVDKMVGYLQGEYNPSTNKPAVIRSETGTWGTLLNTVGIHAYNAGLSTAAKVNNYLSGANLPSLNPKVIFHMIGANDYGSQDSVTTFKNTLKSGIDGLDAAITGECVHILVQQHKRLDTSPTTYQWSQYGQAMAELAATNPSHIGFINAYDDFDAAGASTGDPSDLIGVDNINLTDAGHAKLAAVVATDLGVTVTAPPADLIATFGSSAQGITSPLSMTIVAGSNRAVCAYVANDNGTTAAVSTGMTLNGVAGTKLTGTADGQIGLEVYWWDSSKVPAAGTYNLAATFASAPANGIAIGAIQFNDCPQGGTPVLVAFHQFQGTNTVADIVTTRDHSCIFAAYAHDGVWVADTSGSQVDFGHITGWGGAAVMGAIYDAGTPGTKTVQWQSENTSGVAQNSFRECAVTVALRQP